ncbi:MAG: Asp-tRNA(Asn)/Glu-tRNA(Gln) amidotransferase subunit GatC [Bdellovibrionales bacterium]|nr:Asp-tRNA(Asn)/Glu-tRNA(Gln) amidotransferase subunit GatC [Bdellovibrionales bacterium]
MVSKDEVMKVAHLAHVRLSDAEVSVVQQKFAAILNHFNFLSEANTNGVEPSFHAAEQMELRADVAEAPLDREALLKNAPDQFENCFRISRVVGGEE